MTKIIGLKFFRKIDRVSLRQASSAWCALLTTLVMLLLTPVLAAEEPGSLDAQLSPRDSNRALIGQLLDGLHRAAAESDAQDYFARYTEEAVFLGTDASERWSIASLKPMRRNPSRKAVVGATTSFQDIWCPPEIRKYTVLMKYSATKS